MAQRAYGKKISSFSGALGFAGAKLQNVFELTMLCLLKNAIFPKRNGMDGMATEGGMMAEMGMPGFIFYSRWGVFLTF
jgi:hypothetical protein